MVLPSILTSQIVIFVNGSTTERPSLQGARDLMWWTGWNWARAQPRIRAVSGAAGHPSGPRPRKCIIIAGIVTELESRLDETLAFI
jgi:hypothetical protein